MNRIELVQTTFGPHSFLDIVIDGSFLCNYFRGIQGNNPSLISPLGWSTTDVGYRDNSFKQFLLEANSILPSGRVPMLVCEECGDERCGCLAAYITFELDRVIWQDWAFENGYEEPRPHSWEIAPNRFEFLRSEYDRVFREHISS